MPRITITEPGKSPQPYRLKLERQETTIGRASDNAILIEAGSASTYHCVMERVEGGFTLRDLDSTNGIKIDDTRFAIIDLEDDMIIHIGDDVELHFTLSEEELDVLELEDFQPSQKVMFPKSKKQDDDDDFEETPKKKSNNRSAELDDEYDDDDFEEAPKKRKKRPADLDDDFEDEPPRRKSKPAPAPARRVTPVASSKPSGAGSTLLFFILCIAALFLGLVIRHYQDNGTFIFAKPAKTEAPAAEPATAE